jgi:hypothetical protein
MPCTVSSQWTTAILSACRCASEASSSAKITDCSSRFAYTSTTRPVPLFSADLSGHDRGDPAAAGQQEEVSFERFRDEHARRGQHVDFGAFVQVVADPIRPVPAGGRLTVTFSFEPSCGALDSE